jgi:hypothetical protein
VDGYADMVVLFLALLSQASVCRYGRPEGNLVSSCVRQISNRAVWSIFLNFASGAGQTQDDKPQVPIFHPRQEPSGYCHLVERILRENRMESYGKELMMQLLGDGTAGSAGPRLTGRVEESLRVRTARPASWCGYARDSLRKTMTVIFSPEVASYVFLSQGYFTRCLPR